MVAAKQLSIPPFAFVCLSEAESEAAIAAMMDDLSLQEPVVLEGTPMAGGNWERKLSRIVCIFCIISLCTGAPIIPLTSCSTHSSMSFTYQYLLCQRYSLAVFHCRCVIFKFRGGHLSLFSAIVNLPPFIFDPTH